MPVYGSRGIQEGDLADRALFYGLLARLFREEVDEELLSTLRQLSLPVDTESEEANAGASLILGYLEQVNEASKTELAIDFARIFIVREQHTKKAPYPFESSYASTEKTMMGDARDQVLARYRAAEFEKAPSSHLAEDHLAVELEFEQTLSLKALACVTGNKADEAPINAVSDAERELLALLKEQQAFLEKHILSWLEPFLQEMESWAQTGFYQGVARFTRGFLSLDKAFLEYTVGGNTE